IGPRPTSLNTVAPAGGRLNDGRDDRLRCDRCDGGEERCGVRRRSRCTARTAAPGWLRPGGGGAGGPGAVPRGAARAGGPGRGGGGGGPREGWGGGGGGGGRSPPRGGRAPRGPWGAQPALGARPRAGGDDARPGRRRAAGYPQAR